MSNLVLVTPDVRLIKNLTITDFFWNWGIFQKLKNACPGRFSIVFPLITEHSGHPKSSQGRGSQPRPLPFWHGMTVHKMDEKYQKIIV